MRKTACLVIALGAAATAYAKSDNALTVGLNVGYKANAFDSKNTVEILPHAFYDGDRFFVEGADAGLYAYKDDKHRVRFGLSYDDRSFDPKDAHEKLKNLTKRDASALVHASYMYITPIGGFRLKASFDALGTHDGSTVSLAHVSRFQKDDLTLYPSVGVAWRSQKYNAYYYGVDEKQAQNADIAPYRPQSSSAPFAALMLNYDLNDKWALFGYGRVEWLDKEAKNSPMTSKNQQSVVRAGLSYKY